MNAMGMGSLRETTIINLGMSLKQDNNHIPAPVAVKKNNGT